MSDILSNPKAKARLLKQSGGPVSLHAGDFRALAKGQRIAEVQAARSTLTAQPELSLELAELAGRPSLSAAKVQLSAPPAPRGILGRVAAFLSRRSPWTR